MKQLAPLLPCILLLAACGAPPEEAPLRVSSRAPSATYDCVIPRLQRLPVRTETRQATEDGWRVDVEVYASPPSGWYRKGTIEHSGGTVFFLPDSATDGIELREIEGRIGPIIRRCSGR